jgi:four helix bundle protein
MQKVNSCRDLVIWQRAHSLAGEVLDICENLNGNRVVKEIAGQLIRSAISVPANVAEGYGGRSGKEYVSFLFNARKSLTETDYWLLLAGERGLVKKEQAEKLQGGYLELLKMLNSAIRTLSESKGG